MSYLETFETELARKLVEGDDDATIRFVSEKVLESYRNGIKAGQNGEQVIRNGKSRRPYAGHQAR